MRSINLALLFACVFCVFSNASPGVKTNSCDRIFLDAQDLFNTGQYDLALKKLSAFKLCDPGKIRKADSLMGIVYQTINNQRREAIQQRDIARKQAKVIKNQRDSILKEFLADRIAAAASQKREINPTEALSIVNTGFCYSPKNSSLLEMRRKLLEDEILFKGLEGTNPNNTSIVSIINEKQFVTGDESGTLIFWDTQHQKKSFEKKVFESAIRAIGVLTDKLILVSGNDSKDFKKPDFKVKLLDLSTSIASDIYAGVPCSFIASTSKKDSVLLAFENSEIKSYSLSTHQFSLLRKVEETIIGLVYEPHLGKAFYATSTALFQLNDNVLLYQPLENQFITLLSKCSSGKLNIGQGQDLLQFNLQTGGIQLLRRIHSAMVTSCMCDETSGYFLTGSMDGYAILWSQEGAPQKEFKGNGAEIYGVYLGENARYGITMGRRKLGSENSADTKTVKWWYVNGTRKLFLPEAHAIGGTSVCIISFGKQEKGYCSSGNDGLLKVWDGNYTFLDEIKISNAGIHKVVWNETNKQIAYITYDGEVGLAQITDEKKLTIVKKLKRPTAQLSSVAVHQGFIYVGKRNGIVEMLNAGLIKIDSLRFKIGPTQISVSPTGREILLATGKTISRYNLATRQLESYANPINVNDVQWLDEKSFATVSGQYLRLWKVDDLKQPVLKADNNQNTVLSNLCVDTTNRLIYTGTRQGYFKIWDYQGNQLFHFTVAAGDKINQICLSENGNEATVISYLGSLSSWISPLCFIEKELRLPVVCPEELYRPFKQ